MVMRNQGEMNMRSRPPTGPGSAVTAQRSQNVSAQADSLLAGDTDEMEQGERKRHSGRVIHVGRSSRNRRNE